MAQPANAEAEGDVGLISRLGRSLGGGNGNLLQFSQKATENYVPKEYLITEMFKICPRLNDLDH